METNTNEIVYLYLDDIIPNRFQPRQVFDEKALKELAVSIKEHGVIQPIIVRNIGNKYEIIAGERRYKASALAGLTKIPAIIRNLDDKESSKVALLENLQRKNLNPIEEARTYQKILELDQMTQEELAKTMGKSQSSVANKLRLLSLSEDVQNALLKEQISERHARALLNISDSKEQKNMLKEVITKKMTVRELEETIKQKQNPPLITPESNGIPVSEIEKILQPNPVPVTENSTITTPVLEANTGAIPEIHNNTTNDFNQTVGIDYSTPPKFIDYDMPSTIDNLSSSALQPVNIDELKAQAKDINVEKPKADLDSLLKVTSKEEENNDSAGDTGRFKFFQPVNTEKNNPPQEQNFQQNQDIFNMPTPKEPANQNQEKVNIDSFIFPQTTPPAVTDDSSSSMDSLLESMTKKPNLTPSLQEVELPQSTQEPKIPYIDTFNNPFARNPIFKDDVQKIEGIAQQQQPPRPNYTLNEAIQLIRDTVRNIENSGYKIDSEEMDFEKNYQIVIRIAKQKEERKVE